MKFHIAALTTVILIFSSLAWSADYRFDGNWWIDQKMNEKDFYLIGLFDGMDLGHRFSCWKFLSNKTKADQSCFAKVRDSFKEYNQEYFSNVTIGQLSDGLDSFYVDYKNRRILVWRAVWIVVNGIAGTPEEELNKLIEAWRRNSSK